MKDVASLVKAVKNFANENYEKDGWDIVVECYSDAEIEEIIGGARTPAGAIKKVKAAVAPAAGSRAEVYATAF